MLSLRIQVILERGREGGRESEGEREREGEIEGGGERARERGSQEEE